MKIFKGIFISITDFLVIRIVIPSFLVFYFSLGTVLHLLVIANLHIRAYIKEVVDSFQSFVDRTKEEEAYLELKTRLKKFLS